MRACCGAPAARGSPSRPARWAYGIFWGVRVARGERFTFSLRSETTGQRHVSSVGWLLPSIGAWSPAPFVFSPLAGGFSPASGRGRILFSFFFFATGLWLLPGIRAWSPARRAAGGERGVPLYTPYDPRTPPCPCGGGRRCRMSCTLSAARRRGRSAQIFPLRGRYARLLRRSRCAGIAFAPRLAGRMGLFSAFALRGGEFLLRYEDSILTEGSMILCISGIERFLPSLAIGQQVSAREGKKKERWLSTAFFSEVKDSPSQCTESIGESCFSCSPLRDDVSFAMKEQRFSLVDVSAAGRGGDRRPERGGSSDAGRTLVPRRRGTAGGR